MPLDLLTRLTPFRRVCCPFCLERFAAYEMYLRCDEHDCKNDYTRIVADPIHSKSVGGRRSGDLTGATLKSPWWVDPLADLRRGWRRHFDRLLLPKSLPCPNCGRPADRRLCPRCHRHIPDSAIALRGGHIAIFGPRSVGKTTFVAVLLHELDQRVGPESGFALDPLTDETRERYEREYHDQTYGTRAFGVGDERDGGSFRHSHSATPSLETKRTILQPLVFRISSRPGRHRAAALLSIFDTAGKDWEMNLGRLRSEARYLSRARGLLFLIDPLRIRAVAHDPRLRLTEKERCVPPVDYLNDIRKLVTFFPRTSVKTPLAICLNKLDRWGKLLPKETKLYEWACGVPEVPPSPGTELTIHDEVQSALRHWGATGFLEHVSVNFPNHRFFACSTLGDAAQDREDLPQPLPPPLLVERPVLWLLRKQRVI